MMQRNNFDIRKAEVSDVSEFAELEKLCFSAPWSENALRETMEGDNSCFLVAEENGRVCGYIGSYYALDEGYITNVAVHPDCRRRGIGQALVGELVECGKQLGLLFLTLEVREGNCAAISLYEKLGFKNVGKRPRFYTNPSEAAVLMTIYI